MHLKASILTQIRQSMQVVGLIGCGCPSTKWYNAGSQLLSSLSCWLSVDYDDKSGECLSQLKSVHDDSGGVTGLLLSYLWKLEVLPVVVLEVA